MLPGVTNGIHTNKNKNQLCRDPNYLNGNMFYPLTSVSLSSHSVIMQQVQLEFGHKTEVVRGKFVIGKAIHCP